jgi:radical SAM superfamily enzyme YgiQ (UPF0313 family)
MSRVAIVRPPTILHQAMLNSSQGVPSIGVAYLAGSLKAAGHQVVVIDAFGEAVHRFTRLGSSSLLINGLPAREIVERIPTDVDLIGVSCMYSNEWVYYKVVIQAIFDAFPGVVVVAGGEHVTADPEYVLTCCPGLHSCVLGEGEETFVELLDAIAVGRPMEAVNGLVFIDAGRDVVRTKPRSRLRAVDEIPIPSWEETPLENYLTNGLGMASVRGRNMPMIASRGCPYQCTFCSNPEMWTQYWVARDPRQVVEEMKLWMAQYQVRHFEFYDLTAIVRRQWIVEFTDILLTERLDITWALPSGTRSEALDAEVVDRLYRTGCHELTYAPESGSPATLKRIKKEVSIGKMLASMRAAVRRGILIKANMIFGFPGQTKWEVLQSFWFMVRLAAVGVQDVAAFPFVPYPGSELFKQLVAKGQIDKSGPRYEAFLTGNVYNEVSGMKSWSEHVSDRGVKLLSVGGMAGFYAIQFLLRPWRVAKTVYRLTTQRPRTMLERTLDGVGRNFIQGRRRKVREIEPPSAAGFEAPVSPSADASVAVKSGRLAVDRMDGRGLDQ